MAADKLICMTVPETQPIALPLWTPLADAERVLYSLIADRMPEVEPANGAPFVSHFASIPPYLMFRSRVLACP